MTMTSRRTYVPADADPADFAQLEPLYRGLLAAKIESPGELDQWLARFSELTAVVSEYGSRRYIDKASHTDDPQIEKQFLHFVENVRPKITPLFFELQKMYLACPHRGRLTDERFAILSREWQADVDLFRPQNVPLQTQETKLSSEYDKICAAMVVQFGGQEYTLQQLAKFTEQPDRATRQEAWELAERRRRQDHEKIDEVFDQLLSLRRQIAANADCADYREYIWRARYRFDYTPEDCLRFGEAVEATCKPVVEELDRQRQADLKVSPLRPFDLAVDPQNRPPLRPFEQDQIPMFVEKTGKVFDRLSPELAADFRRLQLGEHLDLESRKGKRPGGFQSSLEEVREPFIFMNATGRQADVETLLHEAGHAFHYLASRREPLVFLRHSPLEFAEVASMSMEIVTGDHLGVFYNQADAARAKRQLLEGIVRLFPWVATIDGFQHWLYTHPGHTQQQRQEAWLATHRRFASSVVDWSGYEEFRQTFWQRQLHVFNYPFYYIEYGIAQLGALQLWQNFRRDPRQALAQYRTALSLGGTRPLPRLFEAAGIRFDFSKQTLGPLMEALRKELAALPR